MKYEGVKKELRKKDNDWRVTGGGPSTSHQPTIPEEEIILRDTIALSVRGLQPQEGDDDVDEIVVGIDSSLLEMEVVNDKSEEINVDWSSLQPRMYQTQKAPALRVHSPVYTSSPIPAAIEPRTITPQLSEQPEGTSRRRPVLQKKRTVRSSAGKFEELATRKIEITDIKREIALKKSRLLDLKIEDAEMRLILTKKELAAHQVGNQYLGSKTRVEE
ncbi:hypothetical protein GE061_020239 [Apolygus lucorum]|uniref:Uncharacterized protein n=1 Tax=Apolygus lucorum TaxID=248454 RepID=A0A8S9WHA7_APOLU|nr:hypothetical protein GE061_020239 [Apolygus lucorum]